MHKRLLPWYCAATLIAASAAQADYTLDRIAAVVDDEVITESELDQKLADIKRGLARGNTQLPPDSILARQVLERLIIERIQMHLADKAGIRVDDETLRQAAQQIAQRNHMSLEQLRDSLRQEGMDYSGFIEQIRGEIITQRLRASQVNSQIKISDREVQHWLDTQDASGMNTDTEYQLGHILIATPRAASPADIQKAKERADKLVKELNQGLDFKKASLSASDSDQALSGGDLGWRKLGQLPSLFADVVGTLHEGEIAGPIRSPSGFHIIKLMDVRGGGVEPIVKTHVRHILIRPNEVLSDEEAEKKLRALKARVEGGDDFATLARGHSDDKGSAIKGGDLGWVQPGALVHEFEDAMTHLDINQISEPVQSQFGWHLIQVLGREQSDDTQELLKKRAHDELFKRKVDEETELWMRRIRDEAYVEIRLQEPAAENFFARPMR